MANVQNIITMLNFMLIYIPTTFIPYHIALLRTVQSDFFLLIYDDVPERMFYIIMTRLYDLFGVYFPHRQFYVHHKYRTEIKSTRGIRVHFVSSFYGGVFKFFHREKNRREKHIKS